MNKSSISISTAIVLGVVLLSTSLLQAQKKEAPLAKEKKYAGSRPEQPFKLLFSTAQDITNTWGQLHFSVTPLSMIREVEKPPFNLVGCFPLADGTWEVFGQEFEPSNEKGIRWFERTSRWKMLRGTTTDGVTFTNMETVIEDTQGTWTSHLEMAYNPDAEEYLMLKIRNDSIGHGYYAFFSKDGKQWQEHSGNPLFYEGDAMWVFWSPVLKEYVVVSKSYQPWPTKHIIDHSPDHRRVLMMRSSPDGRNWNPSQSLPPSGPPNYLPGRTSGHPTEWLTKPDEHDPPDMEFYSGNGFWYHDRAYMIVCNYAASPLTRNTHAPFLDTEWWVSYDGLQWERPGRGVHATTGSAFTRPTHIPLLIGDQLLLNQGNRLLGIKRDRISFVSARANAEFSTRPFVMPAADLVLNAAVPAPERLYADKNSALWGETSAYVMVDILDEQGQIIPGFEATKCVIQKADGIELPLHWDAKSARELAGRQISLRFYLRSANIYAVTTK